MKSPVEIKSALECIGSSPIRCSYCAYDSEDCVYRVGKDALSYIQQLENKVEGLKVSLASEQAQYRETLDALALTERLKKGGNGHENA